MTATARSISFTLPQPAFVARGVLLVFTLLLPMIFDLTVPEVAGDIRWTWNHVAAGLLVLIGIWGWYESGKPLRISLMQPVVFWWAALLALWAAVSLVDSMNVYRGIVPIKALYAQLLLIPAVYLCWHKGFTRKLVWMMVLPLGYCAFVGFCQFFQWNDPSFKLLLTNTTGLGWLGALWPTDGIINWLVTLYLQSAVPGSTFANKNLAGSYTVMVLPLALYLIISSRKPWGKALASLLFGMGSLFLLYSRARASWVALMACCVVLAGTLALSPAWRGLLLQRCRPAVLAACLLPTVLLIGLFAGAQSPVQGAHGLNRSAGEQMGALVQSSWNEIGGRVAYNLNGLMITKDHWFNGVGLGCFFSIYPAYNDTLVSTPDNSYNVMARPQRNHDDLMQAFTEMGIPGGVSYAALLLTALVMAWKLGTAEAVRRTGLFPLFGGLSLLVISVNALMDFPMQLPVAPALACMLIGLLVAHYHSVYPKALWGWNRTLTLPRMALPVVAAVWLAVMAWALWDDYYFRLGNQTLKAAMVRMYSGANDDETLRLVNLANTQYPYDPRIHEHMAVVNANYKGSQTIPIEQRIDTMEWILAGDPWGPNHLVNLSGQYLALAEANINAGNTVVATKALERVDALFVRLQRVASFSHFTWGVGGMMRLLQGRNVEAFEMMQKAVSIQPDYAPAVSGLAVAKARLGIGAAPAAVTPSAK